MSSRPRPRLPRGRKAVLAGLAAALVVAVPLAWASHDFTDVPTAHPFHDDIAAVKDAGITAGKTCVPPGTPPTYCPSESITREAMAAFIRRGVGRIDMDQTANAPDIPISGSAFTSLLTETMVVGGSAGNQYVKVEGWYTVDTDDNITTDCELETRVVHDLGQGDQIIGLSSFDDLNTGDVDQTLRIAFAFPAPSGSHSYTLQGRWFGGTCNDADDLVEIHEAVLIVETFPLNQSGFSDPGALGPADAAPPAENTPREG